MLDLFLVINMIMCYIVNMLICTNICTASFAIMVAENKKELDDLNVKTELDLRQPHTGETGGITSSPLGEGVTYINCPIDWSGDLHGDNNGQNRAIIMSYFQEDKRNVENQLQ